MTHCVNSSEALLLSLSQYGLIIKAVNSTFLSTVTFSLDLSYFQGLFYSVHAHFVWPGLLTSIHGRFRR